MEFRDVVRRRRMVRRYSPEPVDPAAVDRMLEHAQRAPNAGFSQGWAFLVLDTPTDVELFWWATGAHSRPRNAWLDGMRTAPVVIVPLACKDTYLDRYAEPDKSSSDRSSSDRSSSDGRSSDGGWTDRGEDRWPVPYWYVDTGMAALLILQTAVDEGLGACFFGVPSDYVDDLRSAFSIPANHTPVGAITVGHRVPDAGSKGSPARRERRDDVVHRGRW